MGGAYVASGKEHIFNVCRIKHAVGNTVRRWCGVKGRRRFVGGRLEASGIVIVHRPSAVGYHIVEFSACLDIVLRKSVRADVSARFALAGQKANPFKLPVFGVMVAVILYVIPDTEGDLKQLVAQPLGVMNGIVFSAKLYPPEVSL